MTDFKKDAGKPKLELVDPTALVDLAAVLTMGAAKYSPNGWRKAINDDTAEGRIIGALLRHVVAHQLGETFDAESGLPHMAHVMCNAMFLTWLVRERERLLTQLLDVVAEPARPGDFVRPRGVA